MTESIQSRLARAERVLEEQTHFVPLEQDVRKMALLVFWTASDLAFGHGCVTAGHREIARTMMEELGVDPSLNPYDEGHESIEDQLYRENAALRARLANPVAPSPDVHIPDARELSKLLACQRQSKSRPPGRSKTRPFAVMAHDVAGVVPVVHRRAPRGLRSARPTR